MTTDIRIMKEKISLVGLNDRISKIIYIPNT